MELETFAWLLTGAGQELLHAAEQGDLGDAGRLAAFGALRRLASPERAAAAYETALLRRRAAAKFPAAARMYFTREALEQASGAAVAGWRARRYRALLGPGALVADLCCSVGGDALALAEGGLRVVGVDRDRLRLAMAAANAHALGLDEHIRLEELDLELAEPPPADAIFFDPARRAGGRRVFALADYAPPVALAAGWRTRTPALAIKAAPGIADEELASLGQHEAELVSLGGELKEAAVWFGPLAAPGRRATVLAEDIAPGADLPPPSAPVSAGPGWASMFHPAGEPLPRAELAEPLAFLYEPDPAVIRAHLVGPLALQIGAAQLDPEIAYLTAAQAVDTPFARCWRVLAWLPFGLKRLRARVRELGAGAVTVKKRGSPLDTGALAAALSGKGGRELVVVLTQAQGRPVALICEGPIHSGF